MIELLGIFDYIVFQLILHCKDMFSAAFMNKIKILVCIIYIYPCNEIVVKN